jgi:putative transposase
VDQRTRFVVAAERRKELGLSFGDLCAAFGVSRKTGYKWLHRWEADGAEGLQEHSRVARRRPHAVAADVRAALLELKSKRPSWGAKKLRGRLRRLFPETRWPAVSTIHEMLLGEGLVRRKPRDTVYTVKSRPVCEAHAPNDVWAADYKGWVLLKNGSRCEPFTLTDLFSRKALTIRAHEVFSSRAAWGAMEAAFRSYGLPAVVRTDTGVPLALGAV